MGGTSVSGGQTARPSGWRPVFIIVSGHEHRHPSPPDTSPIVSLVKYCAVFGEYSGTSLGPTSQLPPNTLYTADAHVNGPQRIRDQSALYSERMEMIRVHSRSG
jgi:hypothetical protein